MRVDPLTIPATDRRTRAGGHSITVHSGSVWSSVVRLLDIDSVNRPGCSRNKVRGYCFGAWEIIVVPIPGPRTFSLSLTSP